MRKEKFGNVIFPRVDSWLHGHQCLIRDIHAYLPIPENVVDLPGRLEIKKKKMVWTKRGKEWSLLSEYTCPYLFDSEKWMDYIRYDGASRWTMRSINVLGDERITKRYGTKALIEWVRRREGLLEDNNILPREECEFERRLGVVLSDLLIIAMLERAEYCIDCIGRVCRGEPLVKPKLNRLQITEIKGVTIKGIWVRRYKAFFVAETPEGEVFLNPPNEQGVTSAFGPGIRNLGPRNPDKNIKLTRKVRERIAELEKEFILASRAAMAKNGS